MKDFETEEKKQAAADVLFQYSKFALACIGNNVRPCDFRLHLMKEISCLPTYLIKPSSPSSNETGETSTSGTSRHDESDRFTAG